PDQPGHAGGSGRHGPSGFLNTGDCQLPASPRRAADCSTISSRPVSAHVESPAGRGLVSVEDRAQPATSLVPQAGRGVPHAVDEADGVQSVQLSTTTPWLTRLRPRRSRLFGPTTTL